MSEGLKEKTKKCGCYHCSCCRFYHGFAKGCELPGCAYVLVSVAQRDKENELSKQQEAFQKQVGYLKEDIKKLERERGLLKQKLHQFPKLPKNPNTADRINHSIECLEWLEQFRELLRE